MDNKKKITAIILENCKLDLVGEEQICTLNENQLGSLIDDLNTTESNLQHELKEYIKELKIAEENNDECGEFQTARTLQEMYISLEAIISDSKEDRTGAGN